MLNNDWIVANINNPDYSTEMFKMKGIDTDNTQMLREESYLKSNFIINNPAFADKNGENCRKINLYILSTICLM